MLSFASFLPLTRLLSGGVKIGARSGESGKSPHRSSKAIHNNFTLLHSLLENVSRDTLVIKKEMFCIFRER